MKVGEVYRTRASNEYVYEIVKLEDRVINKVVVKDAYVKGRIVGGNGTLHPFDAERLYGKPLTFEERLTAQIERQCKELDWKVEAQLMKIWI